MLFCNKTSRALALFICLLGAGSPAFAQQQPDASSDALEQMVAPPAQDQGDPAKEAADMAFKSAIDSAMPLSPEQIQQLINRMSSVQQAAAPTLHDPTRPTPRMKVDTISLDPSATPPVIKLAAGYVTTLMIMDASGAPWEVTDLAYAGKFEIRLVNSDPHIVRIIPMNRFYEGNLTLQLNKLSAPVTFRLVAGNDEVYYRYDVRIPAMGPNARAPRMAGTNSMIAGDATLTSVLEGYPPAGAKRLQVLGTDDRSAAWEVNGQVYLRTPFSLLSPAWSASTASGDGTSVYAIPDTPVLLLSDQGLMVRARLVRPEAPNSNP